MTFRPHFRLSLLFVAVALVAGVTVWLRQAVVRDRNIRALLAEDYVKGDALISSTDWNSMLLNLFSSASRYCNKINKIEFLVYKSSITNFLNEYRDLDLGQKIKNVTIIGMDIENYTKPFLHKSARKELRLSELLELLNFLSDDAAIIIDSTTIINDLQENPTYDSRCMKVRITECNIETNALRLLMKYTRLSPQSIIINGNDFRGSENDLLELGFKPEQIQNYNEYNLPKTKPFN